MSSLYAPYRSLDELLHAAGVTTADMDRFSTQELLDRAKLRGRPAVPARDPAAAPVRGRPPTYGKEAKSIRSVYLTWELQKAVDAKARASGTNFSEVVRALLEGYIHGR